MKTNDPVDWMKLRSHVGIDSTDDSEEYSEGREIVRFCENFADLMENDIQFLSDKNDSVGEHFREMFEHNFLVANGLYLDFPAMGEALVLLASNWVHGELMVDHFSPIENKLFADSLRKMLAAKQLIAEDTERPDKKMA